MIAAGFGFRSGAGAAALGDALRRAAGPHRPDRLAAPADKADAPALLALARSLALPVVPVSAAALCAAPTATQSAASRSHRGTGSVAEAAALVAAGPGAHLLGPRVVSADGTATCALAVGDGP